MQTTFEKLGGTYRQEGDYLFPNVEVAESSAIGIWGQRLKVYIDTHPFDPGDSYCETVLDQLYQVYAESHESDPTEIGEGFKELEEFLCMLPLWRTTTPSSTSAAICVAHTSEKPLSMACNTGLIY